MSRTLLAFSLVVALSACSVPGVEFTPVGDGGADAPGALSLVLSSTSVTVEEGATATFTVALDGPPAGSVLVNLAASDPLLIGVMPAALLFEPATWSTPQSIAITGRNDDDADNATASISLTSAIGAATVDVDVEDDDVLHLVVEPGGTFIVDENRSAALTVRLSAAPAAPVMVMVASSDPTIATASPAMLMFTASSWNLPQTVAVSGIDDVDVEHENTALSLTAATLDAVDVMLQVRDDDVLGILPTPPNLGTLTEGGGASFTVALTKQPTASMTIAVASSDSGAATATPSTLTFSAASWNTPQTVTVNLPHDLDLADEGAQIELTGPTGIDPRSITFTIQDDDEQIVLATPGSLAFTEGTSRTVDVRLGYQPSADVTIAVTTLDPAVATVTPSSLTFTSASFATTQTVTVVAPHDLDAAAGATQLRLTSTPPTPALDVTVAIADDDPLSIETSVSAVSLGEGSTATFGVRLTAMPAGSVTVNVSSGDPSAATIAPQSLTFSPAAFGTFQNVTVTGVDDLDLAAETVTITFGATGFATRTVTATVSDPDTQVIEVSSTAVSVNETGTGTVGVTLRHTPAASVTVSVSSTDPGAAGVSPAMLTFTPANHAVPQNIAITGVDDPDPVDDTATINLSAPMTTAAAVAVTVNDNDPLGIETSVTTLAVGEAATQTFSVRLTAMPPSSTTVTILSSDTGAATASPASAQFTTSNYAAWQTVTVTGVDDPDPSNESVTLTLTAPGLASRTVTATVADNDPQGIVTTVGAITVAEGATGGFGVHLSAMPAGNVTVMVASADITQATASPAVLTFTPANYGTDQTVTVAGVDDLDMASDSVAISLSATGLSSRTVTATIPNSDVQAVLASPGGPITIAEGATATVGIRLQYAPTANVTVSVAAGTGLGVAPTSLTFTPANHATAQNVTVTAQSDADAVDVLSSITASAAGATPATVMITVDDDEVLLIESDLSSLPLDEGTSATVRVKLSAQPTATTAVTVSSSDTSAATASPTTLSFTTSSWSTYQNVTVAAVHDADINGEGVTITLASAPLPSRTVGVTVSDDDQVTILPALSNLGIDEPSSGSFTVALSNQPNSTVTVSLASSDPGAALVMPSTMTFTVGNWSSSQTATVTGVADADAADESITIALTSPSTQPASVAVTVRDDELVLSDLSVQIGSAAGGTVLTAIGGGFNASTTVALGGRALTSPALISSTQLSGASQSNSRFVDAVATKGASTSTIPRAYYHGAWESATNGLSGGTIHAVVAAGAATVYAGTDNGVYRSTDNGTTWSAASSGLSLNGAIRGLAVDPTNELRIYATTGDGIYVTTNGGSTWAVAGTLTQATTCVAVAPTSAATLYACAGAVIYKSTNSGATWTSSATGLNTPSNVSFSAQDANVAYAASQGGVLKTINGGTSWTPMNSGLPTPPVVNWITASPSDANTAYAAAWNGVYKTTNGGTTWVPASSGMGGNYPSALAIHPGAPSTIHAAASNGMYRSTDGAASWSGPMPGLASGSIMRTVAVRSASASDVYAGSQFTGLFRSSTGGTSWAKSDVGITSFTVMGVAPHPTVNGTAFAMIQGMGLWKTTDRGASWSAASTGFSSNQYVISLAYTPGAPSTMYCGFNGAGVYRSTDGGATWNATGLTSGTVYALAVDPTTTTTLYAATGTGVFKSTNAGTTWSAASTGISGTLAFGIVAAGGALYAVEANTGVYKSTDGAATWTPSGAGLPSGGVRTVVADPSSGALYAQTYSDTYRSTDAGGSWVHVASSSVAVAIDPARPETVYLGGASGALVRRSLTALATAVNFASGLPSSSDAVLAVDRGGATVYLGTYNRGLWRVSN